MSKREELSNLIHQIRTRIYRFYIVLISLDYNNEINRFNHNLLIISEDIFALSRIYMLHRKQEIQILIGVEIVNVSKFKYSSIIYTQH